MKRKITILATVLLSGIAVNAQQTEEVPKALDKKKIELRPNSREYGAVYRDNNQARIDRQKNHNLFMNKRPAAVKPQIKKEQNKKIREQNTIRKQKQIQRRQQPIQRRALRR